MQPCRQPHCPELVDTGFCDNHRSAHRPKRAGAKVYNSRRWKRLRAKRLAKNPICQVCDERLATEVDHIEGVTENPELAYVFANTESMCSTCHGRKTNREVRERTYG